MRTWALGRLSNFVRKSVGTDTVSREYYSYDRERGVQPSVAMLSDTSRYATSDDIYAAVGLLADCAMQIPWTVLVDGEPAPGHDLDILLNNRPNPLYGGHDFWMRAYSTLWLTGEAWLVIERTNPVARSMPNELRPGR